MNNDTPFQQLSFNDISEASIRYLSKYYGESIEKIKILFNKN